MLKATHLTSTMNAIAANYTAEELSTDLIKFAETSLNIDVEKNCCNPEASIGSRASQSDRIMSIRCMPGPQPSTIVDVVCAPNLAKNGADFWLAAILTIPVSAERPS